MNLDPMSMDLDAARLAVTELKRVLMGREDEIARLKQWVSDCQSGMYVNCVYCGHRYGPDKDTPVAMAEILRRHIEKCPKHPLSKVTAERDALNGQINWWKITHKHRVRTIQNLRRLAADAITMANNGDYRNGVGEFGLDEGMSKAAGAMEDLEARAKELGVRIGSTFDENHQLNGVTDERPTEQS